MISHASYQGCEDFRLAFSRIVEVFLTPPVLLKQRVGKSVHAVDLSRGLALAVGLSWGSSSEKSKVVEFWRRELGGIEGRAALRAAGILLNASNVLLAAAACAFVLNLRPGMSKGDIQEMTGLSRCAVWKAVRFWQQEFGETKNTASVEAETQE